ncbi:MAG TPA: DUF4003 family protein [Nannocystaceae bacterium]|nr:DUF4003 family protein [Nannocystaceae bacterium]
MPFRDESEPRRAAIDPFARFTELFAALDAERGYFGDLAPLRLAAIALVTTPGDAVELAAQVRARAAELAPHYSGWSISQSVRLVLAVILVRTGERVAEFVAANGRTQARMKAAKLGRGGVNELAAAMVLRRTVGREPDDDDVQRMRAIYARLEHHHWFLTGADDLVACALLAGREGTPEAIGDHVEAIYRQLAGAKKIWRGDSLLTAATVLGLLAFAPDEAATRFLAIANALRDRGVKLGTAEYDEVAMLSFLPRSAELIAERVADMQRRLTEVLAWHEDASGIALAVDLAFFELAQAETDARVAVLADTKPLLDMQAITWERSSS